MRKTLLLAVVPFLCLASAQADEAKNLNGAWTMTAGESAGMDAKEAEMNITQFAMRGATFFMRGKDDLSVWGALTLHFDKEPHEFELTASFAKDEKPTLGKGIFDLKDDTLKMCWDPTGQTRPSKFAAPGGEPYIFVTLKKVPTNVPVPPSANKTITIPKDETPKDAFVRGFRTYDLLEVKPVMSLYEYSGKSEEYAQSLAKSGTTETSAEIAVQERFGKQARLAYLRGIGQKSEEEGAAADFKTDGDKCLIQFPGDPDPVFQLIRVNGIWKIDIDWMLRDSSEEEIKDMIKQNQDKDAAIRPFVEKIKKGDLKTLQDVILEGAKIYQKLEEPNPEK